MNCSADKLVSFLLLVSSGLFLAGITAFSPIYFLFVAALTLFLLRQFIRFNLINDSVANYNFFLFFFYFTVQLFIPGTKLSNIAGLILPYLFFFLCLQTFRFSTRNDLINDCKWMVWVNILLIATDAIFRLSHPKLFSINQYTGWTYEVGLAYMFKFNSIMYIDANFVGVQITCLYFFLFYLKKEGLLFKGGSMLLNVAFVLVLLTTSRAAIITLIVYSVLFSKISFPFKLTPKLVTRVFITGIFLAVGSIFLVNSVSDDASFSSKFLIINLAINFIHNMSISTFIFGIGIGRTFEYIGFGAHNLLVGLALETGMAGAVLFLLNMYLIAKKTKGKALYLILPFFTIGFSAVSLAIPFLMVQLAVIYCITNNLVEASTPDAITDEQNISLLSE